MAYLISYYHVVFRTYRSARVLFPENTEQFHKYVNGIVKNLGCRLLCINSMPDHVHIAISLKPDIAISECVRDIKGNTSRWLSSHPQMFPYFEGWGHEYFGSTFSAKDLQKVIAYIDNQQKHHRNRPLEDELRDFFALTGQTDRLKYFLADK